MGYYSLPPEATKGATRPYLLRINGESMEDELQTGDMVVVDPDRPWKEGSMVVVRVEHEVTIKRIYREDEHVRLVPTNRRYREIEIWEQEIQILGVIIKIIKLAEP